MENILKPYIAEQIELKQLPEDQKAILYIDCYPVHTGEEFHTFVFQEYPNIFLIFVSANCKLPATALIVNIDPMIGTGIFQPADVGIQRIAKHFI